LNIETVNILNTNIANQSMSQIVMIIDNSIKLKKQIHLTGVNASKLVDMAKDNILKNSVDQSDIIIPDGQSVVWASKILHQPLRERIAGIDLMANVVELAYKNNYRIFLFGAKEEIVKGVVEKYSKQYSESIIAGYRNGYFTSEDEKSIVQQIKESKADILFVAMTSPKQEVFLNNYKKELKNISYLTEVGGSFDVIAGKVSRAPKWMQKNGLEWFYRFLQEPKRMWKRYLVSNSKFIYLVFKAKFKI